MIDFAYVVIVILIKTPVCGTTCPDRVKEERDVTSESDKEVIRRINEKRDRDAEDR